jgi:hypothetical protein
LRFFSDTLCTCAANNDLICHQFKASHPTIAPEGLALSNFTTLTKRNNGIIAALSQHLVPPPTRSTSNRRPLHRDQIESADLWRNGRRSQRQRGGTRRPGAAWIRSSSPPFTTGGCAPLPRIAAARWCVGSWRRWQRWRFGRWSLRICRAGLAWRLY